MREFIRIPKDRLLYVKSGRYTFRGPMLLDRFKVDNGRGRGIKLPEFLQKLDEDGYLVDTDEKWEWEVEAPTTQPPKEVKDAKPTKTPNGTSQRSKNKEKSSSDSKGA